MKGRCQLQLLWRTTPEAPFTGPTVSPYPLEPLKGTCVEEASVNGLGGEPGPRMWHERKERSQWEASRLARTHSVKAWRPGHKAFGLNLEGPHSNCRSLSRGERRALSLGKTVPGEGM